MASVAFRNVLKRFGPLEVIRGIDFDTGDGKDTLNSPGDGLPAGVVVIEPTGSETMVVLRFDDSEIVALFRERHRVPPPAPRSGPFVRYRVRPADLMAHPLPANPSGFRP